MSNMLNIGTSGLVTAQNALDTVANNIANVNTPGYSRQRIVQETLPETVSGPSFVGAGATASGIKRLVDSFIAQSLQNASANLYQAENYLEILQQVDNLLADPTLGVGEDINQFFNALHDVNNDPSSIVARQVFVSQAQRLENSFEASYQQIESIFQSINSELIDTVQQINRFSQEIANLNFQLMGFQDVSAGNMPNELLDKRENLLQNLSQLIGIATVSDNSGAINVFVGKGQPLVLGNQKVTLGTQINPYDAKILDVVVTNGLSSQNISQGITGGRLGGVITAREKVLPYVENALGRIAITLSTTFNQQHQKGISLNGELGKQFFRDPNDIATMLARSFSNIYNSGNGVLSVAIEPIEPPSDFLSVTSEITSMIPANTMPTYASGTFNINGVNIPVTKIGDDTVSTSDALGSAIAISTAINSVGVALSVKASAQENVIYLGTFTPGTFGAGNFAINGVDIITTGATADTLVHDINVLSNQTGVIAINDATSNITLIASDGRNIQLTTDGNATVAHFAYFATNTTVALDQVQRAPIELISTHGQTITMSGGSPALLGFTAKSYPPLYTSLQTTDYELTFDGSVYSLRRTVDMSLVAQSSIPNLTGDGFTLQLASGKIFAGDSFIIRPTNRGATDFTVQISDPTMLALGSPVESNADLYNKGTGKILVSKITNTSGEPISTPNVYGNAFSKPGVLTPPIQIVFVSATVYQVLDVSAGLPGKQIGPDQKYDPALSFNEVFPITSVVNNTLPGPHLNYTYDPGYRIQLQGEPQAGDIFNIAYNNDAISDNRNATLLIDLQFGKFVENNSASFQESFAQLVGNIGSQSVQAQINNNVNQSTMLAITTRRNEVSGVNLDEEATNLLQYEQAYQAAAQIIVIARTMFDTLLHALGA